MAKRVKLIFYTAWEIANRMKWLKEISAEEIVSVFIKAFFRRFFLCGLFLKLQ